MQQRTGTTRFVTRRRGLFLTDMIVGLILVMALTAVLGMMVWRSNLIGRKLADNRAALRLAERVLADLRTQAPTPHPANVQVRRLSDGPAPEQAWVEVSVSVDRRTVTLVGLVDAGRVKKEGAP